jgi:hypothetical protein
LRAEVKVRGWSFAEYLATAGESVFVQFAGRLVFAERAQADREVVRGGQ